MRGDAMSYGRGLRRGAALSPAQFLRKANYYVVTQAQSVYFSVGGDVKEQKSAKKRCLSIAKALHSINKEKIFFALSCDLRLSLHVAVAQQQSLPSLSRIVQRSVHLAARLYSFASKFLVI